MKKLKAFAKKIDLDKLKKTGFFSIFISTIFSKVLVFFGGIIVVRVLSKTDYGIYAYVLNVIAIVSLFGDFGSSSAAMQFILESDKKERDYSFYLKYAIRVGLLSSLISSILILLSPLYYPFTIDNSERLTLILFLVPILVVIQNFIPTILRINLDNKKYGIFQIFITFVNYFALITLSLLFGLIGAIISQYIYYVITIIFGIYLARHYIKKINVKGSLSKDDKKGFLRLAFATQVNNTIGQLLIIVDTFLVGLLISTPESVAIYKVGSAIPHALSFLPTCVVIYILPYFIKNNKSVNWLKSNYKKLIKYGFIIYGVIAMILIAFSKVIFSILYGNRYYDAIPIFIVLVISFFFSSTIKIPSSNITYSLRKVKFNLIVNTSCIVINAISNYVFIKAYGALGAAITTMIISIISSIAYLGYINILLNKKEHLANE